MTGMTPEQIQAHPDIYQQRLAEAHQTLNQMGAQANANAQNTWNQVRNNSTPFQITPIDPIDQQNRTTHHYCRDLSGSVITCRQIR